MRAFDPTVEFMPLVSYDAVGFAVPLTIASMYMPRAVRLARPLDWILFCAATAFTAFSGYCDDAGGHMPAVYGLVAFGYLCEPVVSRSRRHKPAALLVPLLFASIAIPDIYLAYTQSCSAWVTVGGNGWYDGLLLRPLGIFVAYGLLATLSHYSASYRRGIRADWQADLLRHFSLIQSHRSRSS